MAWAHPRLRGEHDTSLMSASTPRGSSPLTRGALAFYSYGRFDVGLIPAYAGSTDTYSQSLKVDGAHPRLRGEHAKRGINSVSEMGSSPLTRGALVGDHIGLRVHRLIPAYAGST